MFKCEELQKLADWLTFNIISWEDASTASDLIPIERIHFKLNDTLYSCINGFGTYGGYDDFSDPDSNKGLIEFYDWDNNPEGYLTADDVIKKIEEILSKKK